MLPQGEMFDDFFYDVREEVDSRPFNKIKAPWKKVD